MPRRDKLKAMISNTKNFIAMKDSEEEVKWTAVP